VSQLELRRRTKELAEARRLEAEARSQLAALRASLARAGRVSTRRRVTGTKPPRIAGRRDGRAGPASGKKS